MTASIHLSRLTTLQVSHDKETAYDDAVPGVDSLLKVAAGTLPNLDVTLRDDSDLTGPNEEPDSMEVVARSLRLPIVQPRVRPETLGFVAAFGMGEDTASLVSTTLAYKHMIRQNTTDTVLPSFVAEGKVRTGLQKKYSGCFVGDFAVEIRRGAERWVSLTANAFASGTVAAGVAATSELTEEALSGGNMAVFFDATSWDNVTADTLSLTASRLNDPGSGVANITNKVTSLRWENNNNPPLDFLYALGSGQVFGQANRGVRTNRVVMSVLVDAYTEVDALTAQTDYALQAVVRGSEIEDSRYYGFDLLFPTLRYRSVEMGDDDGRLVYNIELTPLEVGTYDSVYLDVYGLRSSQYAG